MNFLSNIKLLPYSLAANAGLILVVLFLLNRWIDAKSDIKEEIGRCNSDKLQSALEASEQRREVELAAQARRSVQLASELERARSSIALAEKRATEAQNRADSALEAIRGEAEKDPEDCGNARPDIDFWGDLRMRDSESGH